MAYRTALGKAFHRSIEVIRDETARVFRMEVVPADRAPGALGLWSLNEPSQLQNFATGCDKDIGGLSTCKLDVDPSDGRGRFYGTISTELPRGAKIQRSGYAAFRNKNRPTLFGQQTWDTSMHPVLVLRVRNRLAQSRASRSASGSDGSGDSNSSLQDVLRSASTSNAISTSDPSHVVQRAIHALGIGRKEPPGPKFFVNIQTDGPVTSDLFQHRLWLDPDLGDAWQDVHIPFDDFVLTNTGQVALSQLTMLRERIRTIGLSVVVDSPALPLSLRRDDEAPAAGARSAPQNPADAGNGGTPAALRRPDAPLRREEEDDWARDGALSAPGPAPPPGSRRARAFNFDLSVESVVALGPEEPTEDA